MASRSSQGGGDDARPIRWPPAQRKSKPGCRQRQWMNHTMENAAYLPEKCLGQTSRGKTLQAQTHFKFNPNAGGAGGLRPRLPTTAGG